MADSTRKTNTKKKRQPAKKSRLSSSRTKKPSVKAARKTTAKTKKTTAKAAIKKKPVAQKPTVKRARTSRTKKLNIWLGPRRSLTLSFKLNKKKAPVKKRKTVKKAKKDLSFEKNLILSTIFIGMGVMGSVYATSQIFGGSLGQDRNVDALGFFVNSSVKPEGDGFLPKSVPTHLKIPAVGIDTKLTVAGKKPDGTLAVPDDYDIAGWYKYGPTPGEKGPAVIAGHVNRDHGPGVFGALFLVKKGQVIEITRKDGKIALFKVDAVKMFPQNDDFPTDAVYGNIDHAGLRLITCGGNFSYVTRHYTDNTVVFASFWKVKNKKA